MPAHDHGRPTRRDPDAWITAAEWDAVRACDRDGRGCLLVLIVAGALDLAIVWALVNLL